MKEQLIKDLNEEQCKTLRNARRRKDLAGQVLNDFIDSMLDHLTEEEDQFWEQVHTLMGTRPDTHELRFEWLSQRIVATPIGDKQV